MSKFFKKFDVFAKEFNFPFTKEEKFRSCGGGLCSIIIVLMTLSYLSFFLYLKLHMKRFSVFFKEELADSSQSFPFLKLPVAIGMKDHSSTDNVCQMFSVKSNYILQQRSNDLVTENKYSIPIKNCEFSDFSNDVVVQDYLSNIENVTLFCLERNNKTIGKNLYSPSNITYISLSIDYCSTSDGIKNCLPYDKIVSKLKNGSIDVSIFYEETIFDFTNFSQPISKYIVRERLILDSQTSVLYSLLVENFDVETIFGHMIETSFTDSTQKVVKLDNYKNPQSSSLATVNFISHRKKMIYNRFYGGIFEDFAHFGGISFLLMSLAEYFVKMFYSKHMKEFVIKKMYNIQSNQMIWMSLKSLKNVDNVNIKNMVMKNEDQKENQNKQTSHYLDTKNGLNNTHVLLLNKAPSTILQRSPATILKPEDAFNKNIEIIDKILTTYIKPTLNDNQIFCMSQNVTLFSFWENVQILCFKWMWGKELKKKNNIFKNIWTFNLKYVDVFSLIRAVNELEKLKLVIFDEKQLALFNVLSKPKNPYNGGYKTLSQGNEVIAESYLQELKLKPKMNFVEKRLLDLC